MGLLYAKDGNIYCNDYMEIYIPMTYFKNRPILAVNQGSNVETIGIVYVRDFPNGEEGVVRLINLPVIVNFMIYDFRYETIKVHGMPTDVMTLVYMKDAYVLHQTVTKGREVAEAFLESILEGKLPRTLNYAQVINIWWRNLEISGISYKVPSKLYEMIIAAIYRNPKNTKERYGQYYGNQSNPDGYDYATGTVRSVVKDLSTFSGMVFEDMGLMITNGINNSIEGIDEPVSPLEKIIHY